MHLSRPWLILVPMNRARAPLSFLYAASPMHLRPNHEARSGIAVSMVLALPSGKRWFIERRKRRGNGALSRDNDSAKRVRVKALRYDTSSGNNNNGNYRRTEHIACSKKFDGGGGGGR